MPVVTISRKAEKCQTTKAKAAFVRAAKRVNALAKKAIAKAANGVEKRAADRAAKTGGEAVNLNTLAAKIHRALGFIGEPKTDVIGREIIASGGIAAAKARIAELRDDAAKAVKMLAAVNGR